MSKRTVPLSGREEWNINNMGCIYTVHDDAVSIQRCLSPKAVISNCKHSVDGNSIPTSICDGNSTISLRQEPFDEPQQITTVYTQYNAA
jgi:hypothetical protein